MVCRNHFLAVVVAVSAQGAMTPALACTTFAAGDPQNLLVAKNFDWKNGRGALFVNKARMGKRSLPEPSGEAEFEWTSLQGSLSFNWVGAEFPASGINESGLTVETLLVNDAPAGGVLVPVPQRRLTALQWVQYQLDTSSSTDETVASLARVGFWQLVVPVHFFVCDASARCAVIESSSAGIHIHRIERNELRALENTSYERAVKAFESAPANSPGRFGIVARTLQASQRQIPTAQQAFTLLDGVKLGDATRWQIVWNVPERSVSFRFPGVNSSLQRLSLGDFHFSCEETTQMAILDGVSNQVRLAPMTPSENRTLLQAALNDMNAAGRAHGSTTLLEATDAVSRSTVCRK